MNRKTYQRYNQEFKDQALALLRLGKPHREVAQELEISTSTLYEWQRSQSPQGGCVSQQAVGELAEAHALRALRRQVARLLAENDILKKAAIILGSMKAPSNSAS
jgi:transposase